MAKKLGMTTTTYCNIEYGKAHLKLEDYFKICEILKVSPKTFIASPVYGIECQRLAEEIESLSNRDYLLMRHFLRLLQTPIEGL